MYKTTSQSMQKARGRDVPRKKPVLRNPRARMLKDEAFDFNTAQKPRQALLEELRPVVRRLKAKGNQRPGQLAKAMNAEGWKTAQGRRWNERRVILLLRLLSMRPTTGKPRSRPKRPRLFVKVQAVANAASDPKEAEEVPMPPQAQVSKQRRLAQKRAREGASLEGVVVEKRGREKTSSTPS